MEEEIMEKWEIIPEKLLEYGFYKENEKYYYKKSIKDDSFEIIIIYDNHQIKGKIIDKEFNEEYQTYRIENQIGEFAGSIREEFIECLKDIRNKCGYEKNFISEQANRLSNLIKEKYKESPEFLWDDKTIGVFRNHQNKKWYGIIMYINKQKLGEEDKMIEVMNVKISPEKQEELLKKKGIYKAYHMNKKNWITISLDDSIKDNEIMKLIEESYEYTIETNEWVIPANPKYWDIIHCFDNTRIIDWKQPTNIRLGDIAYFYVGAPYSAILYKCKVIEIDIDSYYPGIKSIMKVELLKKYKENEYPFETLKKYDLRAVRGARRMPKKLIDKIHKDEKNN